VHSGGPHEASPPDLSSHFRDTENNYAAAERWQRSAG
jgi:hypothetical protein